MRLRCVHQPVDHAGTTLFCLRAPASQAAAIAHKCRAGRLWGIPACVPKTLPDITTARRIRKFAIVVNAALDKGQAERVLVVAPEALPARSSPKPALSRKGRWGRSPLRNRCKPVLGRLGGAPQVVNQVTRTGGRGAGRSRRQINAVYGIIWPLSGRGRRSYFELVSGRVIHWLWPELRQMN
jgi:hypothetical protein